MDKIHYGQWVKNQWMSCCKDDSIFHLLLKWKNTTRQFIIEIVKMALFLLYVAWTFSMSLSLASVFVSIFTAVKMQTTVTAYF